MSIHPTAIVNPKAELGADVEVGPFCVIDAHVRLGARCRLYQNVYVTGWTRVGDDCALHPGVIVGHAPQDTKYGGQRSYCRIGRATILREYVTVHRGTVPESTTLVGEECFLLAGAHVGHNAVLGDRVTVVNGTMLGGYVEIGEGANLGGGVAVHQFVRVGELCMIAGGASVTMDVIPYALCDRDGRIAGLNRVGMRRAGMSREETRVVRETYRTLFGRGLPFRRAIERLREEAPAGAAARILRFVEQPSRQGVAGPRRSPR